MSYPQFLILISSLFLSTVVSSVSQAQSTFQPIPLEMFPPEMEPIKPYIQTIPVGMFEQTLYAKVDLAQVLQLAQVLSVDHTFKMQEKIQASQVQAEQNRFFGTLDNSVAVSDTPSAGGFGNPTRAQQTTVSADYRRKTQSGVEYGVTYEESQIDLRTFEVEGVDGGFDFENRISSSIFNVSVTVPLHQDLGDVNSIPIELARVNLQSSQWQTHQNELQTLQQIGDLYWQLTQAREGVRVQKEAVKLSESLLEEYLVRLQAGLINSADVKTIETQLARENQSLRQLMLDVQRIDDLAKASLDIDFDPLHFWPTEIPQIHDYERNANVLFDRTYKNDPTLQALNVQLKANSLQLVQYQNADKQDLDLRVAYQFGGYGEELFDGTEEYGNTDFQGWNVGVSWKVPFAQRVRAEEKTQNHLQREQITERIRRLQLQLRVQVQLQLNTLRLSQESIETAQVARELAQEQLTEALARFKVGEATSFQVSQAQQEALRAQLNETAARIAYEQVFLQLLVLTGDLYSHYNLQKRETFQ